MKNCLYCGGQFDSSKSAKKKFCNDKCKSAFHNQLRIPAGLSQSDRQKVIAFMDRLVAERN